MWLLRLAELYCVRTKIRSSPELMQLEIGTSTSRYFPASGTAGLERWLVRGNSRVPAPPPRITASDRFIDGVGIDGVAGVSPCEGPMLAGGGASASIRARRGPGQSAARRAPSAHSPLVNRRFSFSNHPGALGSTTFTSTDPTNAVPVMRTSGASG